MVSEASFAEAQRLLKCAARACAPYGNSVVIGGRMALLLYRHHAAFAALTRPVLGTREVDAVVPRVLPVRERPIAEALLDQGLVPFESPGLDLRALGKQTFQDRSHGTTRRANEYVEFVAPRRFDDEGALNAQPALLASPLRYIDLLLFEPIAVELEGLNVFVAGPGVFVAQKVLMRSSPSGRREDKDLVSVFEAAELSAPRWTEERAVVARAREESVEWRAWFKRVPGLLQTLFGTATSDGTVAVATTLANVSAAPSARLVSRLVMDMNEAVFHE